MAVIVTEPASDHANLSEWQKFLLKETVNASGFIMLGLTNMDSASAPQIMEGSKVNVNGSTFICNSGAENILPTSGPTVNAVNYIYAAADGSSCSWKYSTAVPTWSAAKGEWYSVNDRTGQGRGEAVLYHWQLWQQGDTGQLRDVFGY
jgi:hypothetical protein